MSQKLNLGQLFQAVSAALVENKDTLNQADTYNHDHGDNMVEIFGAITEAMQTHRRAKPANQLAYASQLLRQRSNSGSAQMYANGLSQAAEQFQGKSVTPDNALLLVQSLLGGGQPTSQQAPVPQASTPQASMPQASMPQASMPQASMPQASMPQASMPQTSPDLLGSLLTGLMGEQSKPEQAQPDLMESLLAGMLGGQASPQQAQTPQVSPDLVGSLLTGLMGGQASPQQAQTPQASPDLVGSLLTGLMGGQSSQQDAGLDMGDLMSAGLAFLNAKQQGKNSLEAIINMLVASSQGGKTPYRAQSSALVVKTLLQMIGSLSGK